MKPDRIFISCNKEPAGQCRRHKSDMGSIPGSGISPGGGHAAPSSILAWRIPWTEELDGLHSIGLQKVRHGMAPHSSTLAWKIPWMEEPGGLQSMGSLRVGHGWATSLSLFTFMHWRRKWQPTPVFLPGEYQGQGSLVCCRLWGCTESDMTEAT